MFRLSYVRCAVHLSAKNYAEEEVAACFSCVLVCSFRVAFSLGRIKWTVTSDEGGIYLAWEGGGARGENQAIDILLL